MKIVFLDVNENISIGGNVYNWNTLLSCGKINPELSELGYIHFIIGDTVLFEKPPLNERLSKIQRQEIRLLCKKLGLN